ncbi:hypothetical protein GCM10020254_34160 [Streptomyces goshikiensis]
MTTRILPAVGDPDAARAISTLLSQLPAAEPAGPVTDSTTLLDTLGRLATESIDELPEVVLVHERIGPPAGPGADPRGRPPLPGGGGSSCCPPTPDPPCSPPPWTRARGA